MEKEASNKKQEWKKYLLIAGILFASALTVCGIIAINNSKEDGSIELLQENEELVSIIYADAQEQPDTESNVLSDEQFVSALSKIFPTDSLSSVEQHQAIATIESNFTEAGITADVQYFNSYGTPGFRITTNKSLDEVQPLLDLSCGYTYYVHICTMSTFGIDECYKLVDDTVECRFSQGMTLGTPEDTESITGLCTDLAEQYNIENVVLTSNALLIYSYNLSTSDMLNVFDYTYQWCLQNDCDRQIILYSSDVIVAASDKILFDEYYINNYPIQELAAVFRLKYYTAGCFFCNAIQETCNIYLV